MKKTRTIEELRQTKDSVYTPPVSHQNTEELSYRFTETTLVNYIIDCLNSVNGEVYPSDMEKVKQFVGNNNS